MRLADEVTAAFEPHGALARVTEQFVPRSGQLAMAIAVADAIDDSGVLVVEASTGVGKTFSYLVPALLSGERVLVSTATKALQDQLFGRDLPGLISALGVPVKSALLKGRSSYLCLHRLGLARQDSRASDTASLRSIAKIEMWSKATRAGDLAELPGLDEKSPLIPLVTSSRENCLGSSCPQFRECHVNLARREALAADVVVINHHLFFADMAVRESGVAELLPTVRVAIFDEAHQLNETGVQFLGKNLTTGQLLDFCRDMFATGLQFARGLVDWQVVVGACETAARELRLSAGQSFPGAKLRWVDESPDGIELTHWRAALSGVHAALLEAGRQLDTVSELAPDFVRLADRSAALAQACLDFSKPAAAGFVRWVDVTAQLRLVESPLSIAHAVKTRLLGTPSAAGKTWIFTSATLGDDPKLSWFTQPCGLEEAKILRVASPFDYASQASLYIPRDFPKPADPTHAQKVAESASVWSKKLGGRTMVLTTTLKSLRQIGQTLQELLGEGLGIEVLVQGAMPKRLLIERFRLGDANGKPGCILVASASFWEGIDMPGKALQLVIIDKLPFPPPNDPMTEARTKALEAEGRSAFNDYFLPEAAVALKQGAGRLIRRESDQGILVICDTRLASMGYGKRLQKALPPMAIIATESELDAKLTALTKACTRDCLPT
jgi:ATP-dependent DNA helicase DinG